MNTDRISLSHAVRSQIMDLFCELHLPFSINLKHERVAEYYADLGWDLTWDRELYTYSIPKNQLTFFLLSL